MGETHAVSFIDILLQYLSIDAVGLEDLSVGRFVLFLFLQPAKGKNTQAGIRRPITIHTIKQIECDAVNEPKS